MYRYRVLYKLYSVFLIFVLFVSSLNFVVGESSIDNNYYEPSPENKNESCILNRTIWNLFAEIDGFNNAPNATGHLVRNGQNISIYLNDTDYSYKIIITSYLLEDYSEFEKNQTVRYTGIVTLNYIKLSKSGSKIREISQSIAGNMGPLFRLTAYKETDSIHIFFSASNADMADTNNYYYIFYSRINLPSDNLDKIKLFYFEKREGHLPLLYHPSGENKSLEFPFVIFAPVISILAVAVIIALMFKKGGNGC